MIGNKPSIYNAPSVYNQGGGGPAVEIGGRKYPTVKIGNKIWTTENLDLYWPGLLDFSGSITDSDTNPRSVYYNNQPNFFGVYGCRFGRLYNGFAVDYIEANLLPPGWHVPTKSDFDALVSYVGGVAAGSKVKSIGYWADGLHADDFGFNSVPTGWYEKDSGGFKQLSNYQRIWSITTNQYNTKFYLSVQPDDTLDASNGYNRNGLRLAASVRVMRDA